jgi:RNA polymerase sigma factor (sigma-70 family)
MNLLSSANKANNNSPIIMSIHILNQTLWFGHIKIQLTEEFYPRMIELNGGENSGKVITTGSSMGGAHSVNFFLRRPDLFNGVISLSGLFDMQMFIGDYMDEIAYMNVPVVYMENLPEDHEYIDLFNNADIAINENREQEMIDQQTLKEVKELIALLPDSQREVLMMRVYDELSFKEIAEKTNCSINTALGRMRYAIINLRHMAFKRGISLAS